MKKINTQKTRHWMALATAVTLAGAAMPTYAGEGHDHGPAPAMANANGPQRMADGSVFLPKPAQRQLNVRTLVAAFWEPKILSKKFYFLSIVTLAQRLVLLTLGWR